MIIDPEIFLNNLLKSVGIFYDNSYHGCSIGKKNYHLRRILESYDRERFSRAENLYEERVKFLEEIQYLVDNEYNIV